MQIANYNKECLKDSDEIIQINKRLDKLELSLNDLIKINEKLLEENKIYKVKLDQLGKKYEEQRIKINNLEKLFNKSESKDSEEKDNGDNIENLIKINSNVAYKFENNPSFLSYNKSITVNKNKNSLGEYTLFNSFLDGKQYLISANRDNYNLNVYDLSNGNIVNSLKGHTNRIDHIRYFSNNNKSYFVSSDTNHTLIVWDDNGMIIIRFLIK